MPIAYAIEKKPALLLLKTETNIT